MKTKEKIIKYLEEHKGEVCSGQKIANEFELTRNAVWNNVKQLIDEGLPIEKVPTKGYRLLDSVDIETEAQINEFLDEDIKLVFLDEIDSTNKYAKSIVLGDKSKQLIVARTQTNGVGRRNRTFESPKYNGIYMTYISDLCFDISKTALLTILTANVVHQIFSKHDIILEIKYLNDLYYNDKKVCGILTEANIDVENQEINDVIIGIGLNLYNASLFSEDLQYKIGVIDEANKINKSQLIAEIINLLDQKITNYDFNEELEYYRKYSLLIGKTVTIIVNNERYTAKVVDIDNDFNLVAEIDNVRKVFHYNQISIEL